MGLYQGFAVMLLKYLVKYYWLLLGLIHDHVMIDTHRTGQNRLKERMIVFIIQHIGGKDEQVLPRQISLLKSIHILKASLAIHH